MSPKVEAYLVNLSNLLGSFERPEREELIREIRDHIQQALAELPGGESEGNMEQVLARLGSPQELAQRFLAEGKVRRKDVPRILASERPRIRVEGETQPWPGLFGIVLDPATWKGLLYVFLVFPLCIFYFCYSVTGFSLSLGLLILIIGIPIAALFLAGSSLLGRFHLGIMQVLLGLGVRLEEPPEPARGLRAFVKQHVLSTLAWKRLGYLFLSFPLGTAYFTVFFSLLVCSVALFFGGLGDLIGLNHYWVDFSWDGGRFFGYGPHPVFDLFGMGFGIVLFFSTFHLIRLVMGLERRLGKYLLADL